MTNTINDVEIRYIRGSYQFGRPVLQGQLFNSANVRIFDGSLAQILQHCKDKNYTVTNAQEILIHVVIEQGFGS